MTPGLIAFVLFIALYLFLIWPAKAGEQAKQPFVHRCFAHRGLYDNKEGVPENSLPAFEAAMRKGYGCELDVQFSADGELVVFHDGDLARACGVESAVDALTLSQLRQLSLFGTSFGIPTLDEVLELVDGRGPLIVELKSCPTKQQADALCEAVARRLDAYSGEFCVESFNPRMVRWFQKNRPGMVRGLLVGGAPKPGADGEALLTLISELLVNCVCRPHFIAYYHPARNLALRIAQKLGAFTVMWTVQTPEQHAELAKKEDCIIFEGYLPEARF